MNKMAAFGGLVRVRELYLRRDVSCGSEACLACLTPAHSHGGRCCSCFSSSALWLQFLLRPVGCAMPLWQAAVKSRHPLRRPRHGCFYVCTWSAARYSRAARPGCCTVFDSGVFTRFRLPLVPCSSWRPWTPWRRLLRTATSSRLWCVPRRTRPPSHCLRASCAYRFRFSRAGVRGMQPPSAKAVEAHASVCARPSPTCGVVCKRVS